MRFSRAALHSLLAASFGTAAQFPALGEHGLSASPITTALFLELEELSRLVDISYCVGLQGPGIKEPFNCPSRCQDFESIELITTWNTGPLLSDSCGYIAVSHLPSNPRIIVAFRGSYSITNAVADLSTIPQEYVPYPDDGGKDGRNATKCKSCHVHMGFFASWKNTRKVILPPIEQAKRKYPDYKLVLVGHSLGGAVSTLGGLELLARGYDPTITTFGEPRLGNQAFVDYVDKQFQLFGNSTAASGPTSEAGKLRRVTHIADPVPSLPLEEWGYMPHGGEIFISKADLPPEAEDVWLCYGQADRSCSIGPETNWLRFPWGFPARFKIWQLFFAHRDYFWRLGLCAPQIKPVPKAEF